MNKKRQTAKPYGPVALISMPTLTPSFPSFQLGLLKPTLERAGISAQTFSLYLYFGAHIGWSLNEELSAVRSCMVGEWIWSKAAFGEFADDGEYFQAYQENFRSICESVGCTMSDIVEVRDSKTFSFIDFCVRSVDWSRFKLIGFSVVFQQMVASLALARALKERYPEIPIALGGATFEDDIAEGILRGCPWVDYVHCGDGDRSFPEMVQRLERREPLDDLKGVMQRRNGAIHYAGRAPNFQEMDSTPIPEFEEYFYAARESGYADNGEIEDIMLPIETSRGCWWGMKQHCTFCGLNRAGMEFRAKSVGNVLQMVDTLARRYNMFYFDCIDNIMEPEYIDRLFGELAKSRTDVRIHYEVRPYLSRQQLKSMREGGLHSVQPGIESFSTHVLKLMKKHSTGIRNLAFLKWCTYYEINNLYNILYGFPGETREDYQQQCELIRKIRHLQPPYAIAQARADRGSPMFTQPGEHAIAKLAPSRCYRFIYPSDRFNLDHVAYYFDHDQREILEEDDYGGIWELATEWQQSWQASPRPSLYYRKAWKTIVLEDARNGAPKKVRLSEKHSNLYEFCNDVRTAEAIQKEFEDQDWVAAALEDFLEADWMVRLDDRYLSLALPANSNL